MIPFDPSKIHIEIVQLKTVSTVLGGSISWIDEKATKKAKKEVLTRGTVPIAVARSFIMRHKKITKYLKPVFTAIVRYEDMVIAMERHPYASMGEKEMASTKIESFDGTKEWKPEVSHNLEFVRGAMMRDQRKWFFDGRYAYTFGRDLRGSIDDGEALTRDGKFRKVSVDAFDLMMLHNMKELAIHERSCLAFLSSRGDFSISAPIWKKLELVGGTQLKKAGVEDSDMTPRLGDDEDNSESMYDDDSSDGGDGSSYQYSAELTAGFPFDKIDEHLCVNLNFALTAGRAVGKTFGYDHIEPLQFPRLMTELCTVNLPHVPNEVKSTYDIGLKFSQAVAWLLGLQRRVNTLDAYIQVRTLLKYLTKRGIFRSNVFDRSRVFVNPDMKLEDVQQQELDQLLGEHKQEKMSLAGILLQAELANQMKKKGGR